MSSNIFIVGAAGQLGLALREKYPEARYADSDSLDITDKKAVESFDWSGVEILINAAAYTNVDGAETNEGRVLSWAVNADATANLVAVAAHYNMIILHISSDYVFDGNNDNHKEDEPFSPLSAYGASKAAGDIAISLAPKFYILRTSWVIGDGKNFVRTMLELGEKGINPKVVSDQVGRLTFTNTLTSAIGLLISKSSPYGTYNVTNDGEPTSWAEIARSIFSEAGLTNTVTDTTTEEYYNGKENIAPRPLNSTLELGKIKAEGFIPASWKEDLSSYIKKELDE